MVSRVLTVDGPTGLGWVGSLLCLMGFGSTGFDGFWLVGLLLGCWIGSHIGRSGLARGLLVWLGHTHTRVCRLLVVEGVGLSLGSLGHGQNGLIGSPGSLGCRDPGTARTAGHAPGLTPAMTAENSASDLPICWIVSWLFVGRESSCG
jgi:hypothetical protein